MTASEAKAQLVKALREIETFSAVMAKAELALSEKMMRAAFDDIAAYAARTASEAEGGS